MLNENGKRELVYVVSVAEIKPIEGYDRVEYARIGAGWWIIVRKGQFKVGDLAIYFEIDSQVPAKEPFLFLEKRNYKVKTLKMCKVISQGLLMSAEDFGWTYECHEERDNEGELLSTVRYIQAGRGVVYVEGQFLTDTLGVIYADPEDNIRKAPSADKYRSMQNRHPSVFKSKVGKWMMRHEWGRRVMFMLFGRKRDKKNAWPTWVQRTDEERVNNLPWLFPSCDTTWTATEKIDGTSTTFTMRNDRKQQLIICSRNVVFDKPDKKCYYETNVYTEMAEWYNMEEVLRKMIADVTADMEHTMWGHKRLEFITIQGETYGAGIQRRDYGMTGHDFRVFNVIFGFDNATIRLNPVAGCNFVSAYDLKYVPIVETGIKLPATCDEVIAMAHGISDIDGNLREGLVFRSNDGAQSFKAVDPEFLMKYHG